MMLRRIHLSYKTVQMDNKLAFIAELLNSKKINNSQKEKLLILATNEISTIASSDEIILAEIKAIKSELENIKGQQIGNSINVKASEFRTLKPDDLIVSPLNDIPKLEAHSPINKIIKKSVIYLNPKDLKDFLVEYNQNPILKYTCHLIDGDALLKINSLTKTESYNFEKHLKLIKREFYVLTKKYESKINKTIHALIGEYLNNYIKEDTKKNLVKGWSNDKIKVTWTSPELLTWSKEHPGMCPNPDPTLNTTPFDFVPFRINEQLTRFQKFDDLVLHFKSLFHIRRDNSLKNIIDTINESTFSNMASFDTVQIRENIEFFTDVDKVKQAYREIIKMSIDFQTKTCPNEKPFFKLSLSENREQKSIVFSIKHENSIHGKTALNTIERRGEKIDKIIENQINGVCDLVLRANFGDNEFAEVNLWNRNIPEIKLINAFDGVQFDLIFHR